MNQKQLKTLKSIFEQPIRADIEWSDVLTMLHGLGADIKEARGSRVLIKLKNVKMVFHKPHPNKEICKGAVKSFHTFLISAGVKL